MIILGLINLLVGGYLVKDSYYKIAMGKEVLYFDSYLKGFMRYLPIVLGVSMILASLFLILRKSSRYLLHTYVNSFFYILFFTPSLFYRNIKGSYIPLILLVELFVLISSIYFLFAKPDQSRVSSAGKVRTKITYEEYKQSLNKFKEYKLEEENRKTDIEKEDESFLKTIKGKVTSYIEKISHNKKAEAKNPDSYEEDEIVTTSSEDLINHNEKEATKDNIKDIRDDSKEISDISAPEVIVVQENNLKTDEIEKSIVVDEIKLPEEKTNRKLTVQNSNIELNDDDVKIVEDLKEIIN